jgi:hypothetical protein
MKGYLSVMTPYMILSLDVNKIKNKKYDTFRPFLNLNIRGKIDTPNTQIHDLSPFCLGKGTPLSEMTQQLKSGKCLRHNIVNLCFKHKIINIIFNANNKSM